MFEFEFCVFDIIFLSDSKNSAFNLENVRRISEWFQSSDLFGSAIFPLALPTCSAKAFFS